MTYREYMDTPTHVIDLYLDDVLAEAGSRTGPMADALPEPAGTGGWMDVPT